MTFLPVLILGLYLCSCLLILCPLTFRLMFMTGLTFPHINLGCVLSGLGVATLTLDTWFIFLLHNFSEWCKGACACNCHWYSRLLIEREAFSLLLRTVNEFSHSDIS